MSEARRVTVKVTPEDIDSVSNKLQEFARQLPQGEQNVVAWLLGRAASAPPDPELLPNARQGGDDRVQFRTVMNESLGIAQFERLRAGEAFAGSGVGVTGTVNPTGPGVGVTGTIMF